MSVIPLNTDAHQEAQELLPWFVLGTLNAAETAMVQEHLRTCSQCQGDVELQRKMQAVPLGLRVEIDVNSAFAKLKPQLAAAVQEKKGPRFEGRLENLRQAARRWWMPWAIAGQAVALACLCVVVMQKQADPVQYIALGAQVEDKGNMVVMFKPQTAESELRRILQGADARVVDGPLVTGAYVVHVNDGKRAQVLAALRRESAVTMAESLDAGGVK
jgi:ribosomal protein L21E